MFVQSILNFHNIWTEVRKQVSKKTWESRLCANKDKQVVVFHRVTLIAISGATLWYKFDEK